MGAMDKFLKAMKLNDDYDDYDEDYDDYDEDEVEEEKPVKKRVVTPAEDDEPEEKPSRTKAPATKVTPMKQSKRAGSMNVSDMEVRVIKPTSVEDAREVTDILLANRTVVLNLEGLDVDVAQRIIDFTSGSCYAIQGNLQKISHYIFIITPATVDISGDFQEMLSDSFNVQAFNNPL
ncbi:MAG: cell division protein SepF [Lachnospiraceae bacterium]|jgi:cell division inhibitor SepF|nr:cell division protein SepF [Lachnospiraceae bacterium]